jgi:N-acetylmuramoyl-L-alanine amidase
MKELKYLIIHCTATREGQSIGAEHVKAWHTAPPPAGRGWSKVGYSDLILLDGDRHKFVHHNGDAFIQSSEITNGVKGMNSISRHVCYVGGLSADGKKTENTLTNAQSQTLEEIIREVIGYKPDILIAGHNQFDNKACPSFFVPTYLRMVGIPEKNIYLKDPFGYATKLS